MSLDKEFFTFQNTQEELDYLHKYKFLAATKTEIPEFIYRNKSTILTCKIIGYEANYDTFSITVIDFGKGPHFIHSDYLREMQKGSSALHPDKITSMSVNRPKRTEERKKGNRLNTLPDTYIIFDLETTDRIIYNAEIIQIAAIRIHNGEIVDTFCSYVKPQNPIPDSITKLTGITDLDVCLSPGIEIVLPQFLEYIGNSCLAGYNIHSYDINLLFDIAESHLNVVVNNDYFDFYLYFKSILSKAEMNGYKLTDIAEYYGIDTASAHNALADCNLCLECYKCATENNSFTGTVSIQNVNVINTDFEKKLLSHLQEIILSRELPEDSLYLYSNRSNKGNNKNIEMSKSICIHEPEYPPNPNSSSIIGKNYVILKLLQNNGEVELIIRKTQYQAVIPTFTDIAVKEIGNERSKEVHVLFSEKHPLLMDYIMENVLYCLKHYRSSASFSCCSQFTACSDALKCLHENKLYATGCYYRRNLENGRIFYGKNKNID